MKAGFIPALVTPLDANGNLIEASYRKQIEDMIHAGAVGLLSMGSMGQQAFLRSGVCPEVARVAVDAAAGRVPVFVGAMDCSIGRASERIAAMENLDVASFVFTAPYYSAANRPQMMHYFRGVAAATKHNIMLYDLPSVTQSKITYDMVLELLREVPNLVGIKSADQQMFRKLKLNPDVPKDFILVYSGLDTFDVAYRWGIDNCLDGMLPVTPTNTGKMFRAMEEGDYDTAAVCLNHIVDLRDYFAARDLWPCFSEAMNMLGYDGNCCPDICVPIKPENVELVRQEMIRIGEL
ncbi:MAG: dihydrodipicolinate synthase family protein [Oscillospiraceae bacterium]|nr:dihydrodipicolinate synthase family protein [Oscillospiraceae bacterium]